MESFCIHSRTHTSFYLLQLWPTLTLSPFMIWYSGLTVLLLLLAKAALAYLPTALSVALMPLFSFQQAQYVQVFPLKPAPFCTLFAGRGSTNKPATSLLFYSYLTLVLSSPPNFLLPETLRQIWQELSSLLLIYQSTMGLWTLILPRRTTRLMSWLDEQRYLHPPQSLVIFLLSLVSTLLFSRTGGVLPHRNSSTCRFPRFPPRNLCSLVMLTVSLLQ